MISWKKCTVVRSKSQRAYINHSKCPVTRVPHKSTHEERIYTFNVSETNDVVWIGFHLLFSFSKYLLFYCITDDTNYTNGLLMTPGSLMDNYFFILVDEFHTLDGFITYIFVTILWKIYLWSFSSPTLTSSGPITDLLIRLWLFEPIGYIAYFF